MERHSWSVLDCLYFARSYPLIVTSMRLRPEAASVPSRRCQLATTRRLGPLPQGPEGRVQEEIARVGG